MGEVYNVNHYTMNLIPKYRVDYITLRLKWFIELTGLKRTDWPLNCTELLRKIKALEHMHFEYGFADMPDKYDAITEYMTEHGKVPASSDTPLYSHNFLSICPISDFIFPYITCLRYFGANTI